MTTVLRIPGLRKGDGDGKGDCLEIRQEDLKDEADASKYVKLFEENKVGIEYWFQLALMYYRNG